MAFLLIGYAVLGVVVYQPSRRGGEPGKAAYFVAFPFHAIVMPLAEAAGGLSGVLRSKVLLVTVFLLTAAAGMGGGGDPVAGVLVGIVATAFARLLLAGLADLFGE